jgi:uncharacterized membrane protein (DUF106 family)
MRLLLQFKPPAWGWLLTGGEMQDRSNRGMILWFFLALFLASAFMLGWLLWPFLSVIVLGAVVTSIFGPV